MKISENWLREWVNPSLTSEQLIAQLTMSGLEVEGLEKVEDDTVIEIEITPNRGDCLSILGIAREVAALNNSDIKPHPYSEIKPTIKDTFAVEVAAPEFCPRYVGRVIRGIHKNATTPQWMAQKLEKCGIRLIHPVVDILNYVMLERGQPMHAFDLNKIDAINVRMAQAGEKITLLDNQEITLMPNTLVIASNKKVEAIAGIMGGLDSSVQSETVDIFLESALFAGERMAGLARQYSLHTDSSYRFERGVANVLQIEAMEIATQYILEICKGEAGPLIVVEEDSIPESQPIHLRYEKLNQVLGATLEPQAVQSILERFACKVIKKDATGLVVIPSAYRLDLSSEIDLIEEVIRAYGYDNVPLSMPHIQASFIPNSEKHVPEKRIKQALVDLGFQEIISYSFVDSRLQERLFEHEALNLINPIAANMDVMRLSIWPGLLSTLQYNQSRQQMRMKCFETGLCFVPSNNTLRQEKRIAGLLAGSRYLENWTSKNEPFDFYDAKAAIDALWNILGNATPIEYRAEAHSALHPQQSARVVCQNNPMGWVGALHPRLIKELDLQGPVYLFEIKAEMLTNKSISRYQRISKYPEIRRDIAVIVDDKLLSDQLIQTIRQQAPDWLQSVKVFDVYSGKGIESGRKSIAMGLILQHPSRTLIDKEVDEFIHQVVTSLQKEFGAQVRE